MPEGTKRKIPSKLIFFILILLALFLVGHFRQYFIDLLQQWPLAWSLYKHSVAQIEGRTLLGLFYANFFGGLFFVFLPIEVIYVYYTLLDHSDLLIFIVSMISIMIAMILNYAAGRLLGSTVLKFIMKKKFEWLENLNNKYGAWIIVIGNAIIFPSQLYALIVGATKYPFKKYLAYTALGRTIKYVLLVIGSDYFMDVIMPWMQAFM